MKNEIEYVKCNSCGKEYKLIWTYYYSNVDSKRDSYYSCPYCGATTDVHLSGNEDVRTEKFD